MYGFGKKRLLTTGEIGLQFGADVEVIAPDELRRELKAEIEKMGELTEKEDFSEE